MRRFARAKRTFGGENSGAAPRRPTPRRVSFSQLWPSVVCAPAAHVLRCGARELCNLARPRPPSLGRAASGALPPPRAPCPAARARANGHAGALHSSNRLRKARPPRTQQDVLPSLQQLQILGSDWQAGSTLHLASQATGERGRPVRSVHGLARPQAKTHAAAAAPAGQPHVCPSLGAPLLDVSEQHGKDPAVQGQARRSRSNLCAVAPFQRCCCDDLMARLTLQMGTDHLRSPFPIFPPESHCTAISFSLCSARF